MIQAVILKIQKNRLQNLHSDLELANNLNDLLIAKYDNCFTFEDIEEVQKAKEWYLNSKNIVFGFNKKTKH